MSIKNHGKIRELIGICVSSLCMFGITFHDQQKDWMASGGWMTSGVWIQSKNDTCFCFMQGDGHLCVYKGTRPGDINKKLLWVSEFYGFLASNPKELILMALKKEHTEEECSRSYERTVRWYISQNPGYWYTETAIPTLDQV